MMALMPSIDSSFPGLDAEQRRELERTLHLACEHLCRIYERLERERPEVIDELMQKRKL